MSVARVVEALDPSAPPSIAAALLVHRSPLGAHVGLLYRATDGGDLRLVHQAWHYDSRDEALGEFECEHVLWWVPPGLDEDELADLRSHAALVARRLRDGALPYAFDPVDARIGEDGAVDLGASLGLTCATFVMKVFAFARVPLLLDEEWETQRSPTRVAEDATAQRTVARYLRGLDPAHASHVEADVGCTRFRAEEVAAASGLAQRPASFAVAATAGAALLTAVRAS